MPTKRICMYTIIEDCSPFYVRFTHAGLDEVVAKCLKYIEGTEFVRGFTHHRYKRDQAYDIMQSVPMRDQLDLMHARVSLFVTGPGHYYRAHKDGLDHRYSLNYTVKVLDDQCVTQWYSDSELSAYPLVFPLGTSRECDGFVKENHTPLKSMVAVQGECILFNTEIFHDFDNRKSENVRMVLTLRDRNPSAVFFEDAKARIFKLP